MPRTPEGKVKDACVALLQREGAYYFFPVMGGYGRTGIPDIIACHNGRFLAIECKAKGNKPTPLQEAELRKVAAAGGAAMVVREDTLGELERWLGEIR